MNKYKLPPDVKNAAALRRDALARRVALRQAGCTTYTLGLKSGSQAIVCLCCGLGSSHPTDIQERYCGFCQQYHDQTQKYQPPNLPGVLQAAGADGVWLLRGGKSVVMAWVDDEEATDPLQIEVADAKIVLLARFPAGDDKPAGIEYF